MVRPGRGDRHPSHGRSAMNPRRRRRSLPWLVTPAVLLAGASCGSASSTSSGASASTQQPVTAPDWAAVAAALGKSGTVMPGGVYRVGLPRTDLHVTVGDVVLKPGFALGSYVAFTPDSSGAVAVGDLALLESEVPAVTAKLQEEGLQETAVHNHVLNETPRVLFLHFRGDGDPVRLAGELRQVLSVTATPLAGAAGAPTSDVGLDT